MSVRVSSASRSGERRPATRQGLTQRRRTRRRRLLISLVILFALLLAAALYGLHQSAVRVNHIQIFGADPSLATYATEAMQGSYLGVIPRDSIFFFPSASIRANILAADTNVAAVSIFRSGLDSLSIKVDTRTSIARWCGVTPTTAAGPCYSFDASGIIFAPAATTTQTINPFTLYAPIMSSSTDPLQAAISNADQLPATFDFARQLATLGSPVSSIYIHDGEVDDALVSGTRITYVLGDEQNAFTTLVSAQSDLNLSDGSIDYVDLRFDGKVYLKKKE